MKFTSRTPYYTDSLKMGRRAWKTGVCKGSPEYYWRMVEFKVRRAVKRICIALKTKETTP